MGVAPGSREATQLGRDAYREGHTDPEDVLTFYRNSGGDPAVLRYYVMGYREAAAIDGKMARDIEHSLLLVDHHNFKAAAPEHLERYKALTGW